MPNKLTVELMGHAGGDAEAKKSAKGTEYAQFSMAINFGKKDEPKAHTVWFRCMAFHKAREQALDLVRKGAPLIVRGDMSELSAYTNKAGAPAVGATMFVQSIDPYVVEQREERPQSVPQVAPPPTDDSMDLPF